MRVKLSLLVVSLAALSGAQIWEKPIAPGLTYRMEVDAATPRIIHALRFTPGSPVIARPELANDSVYSETPTKGRATVSEMAAMKGAIAAINGDFFPYTGDPLGFMVRDGQVLSVPLGSRSSFGWKNAVGSGMSSIVSWKGSFQRNDGPEVPIDQLNGECGANQIALNTEAAAFSLCKAPNVHVFVRLDSPDFSPNGTATGVVTGMTADEPSLPVQKGTFVIVAHGNKTGFVTSLRAGDKITIRFQSSGLDWNAIDQVISGGPSLVRDGVTQVDAEAQKFNSEFSKKRHPRTAIGRTAAGDIYLVAVDGRQKGVSEGATLQEMGDIMLRLGCREAINLDGGGSSALNIFGVTVNRPSEGKERPVANAILFYGPRPEPTDNPANIEGPATFDSSGTVTLRAVIDGKPVNDADVLWSAQGAGWIDQGGLLRPSGTGLVTVTAWIKGQLVVKEIQALAPKAKPQPRVDPVSSRSGDRKDRKATPVKAPPKTPVKKAAPKKGGGAG